MIRDRIDWQQLEREAAELPFMQSLRRGEVPERAPQAMYDGVDFLDDYREHCLLNQLRYLCTQKLAMWACVDLHWTGELARWLDGRTVLEVMAGKGWLAKALSQHGANIVATDDYSWHDGIATVHEVIPLDALVAVKDSVADVLLVSWPHMSKVKLLHRMCLAWGNERPIIYIGEPDEGCTARGPFWRYFREYPDAPQVSLPQFPGIHDRIWIGHYGERRS